MAQAKPQGEHMVYNGKSYIVTEKKNVYAVQRKVDAGFCFGRKPVESLKYIRLDPAGSLYKQLTKKNSKTVLVSV